MSSVSAADRKSQAEDLRTQREESQNREIEETKKHKKEIKRLLETQDKQVSELKENYSNQLDSLMKKSSEQLSERDQKNQAKIEQLRSMYLDSLKKKTEDSEGRRIAEAETYKGQVLKQRQVADQQKELLVRNFEGAIQNKDKEFYQLSQESRDEMKEAINKQSKKQGDLQQNEIKRIVEDRDRRILEKDRNYDSTRNMYENRLKETKQLDEQNLKRHDNNWRQTYNNKTGEMSALLAGKGEELKMEQENLQGKYSKKLDSKLKALDDARDVLREQGANRIDREVRSLENENSRLRSKQIVEASNIKRIRDLEKAHVIQDYETRMGKLEDTNKNQLEHGREVNQRKVAEVLYKNDDLLAETNRRHRSDINFVNERSRESRDVVERETQGELKHLGERTDNRVKQIQKATTLAQRVEQKQHNENVGALKDSYAESLTNQRLAQMDQLKETYERMENRVKGTQEKLTQKLDETVTNYESKIANLEDKYKKEIKKQAETLENREKSREKAHQMEIKAGEAKVDIKLGQLQDNHEKEIDRLQRRHQEDMASLAQKLSYYRKNTT